MSRFTTKCLCLLATSFMLAAPACDPEDGSEVAQPNFTPPFDPTPKDISAAPPPCVGECELPACDSADACAFDEFCHFEDTCGGPGICIPRPDFCNRMHDPVCGCDGETYNNACMAYAAGVSVAAEGECTCACTLEYVPVCGVDGETYGNQCAADCAGVEVDHAGECAVGCDDDSQCGPGRFCERDDNCGGAGSCSVKPQVCGELYEPVCGCNGETYGNLCEAHGAGMSVNANGACEAPEVDKLE